MGLWYDGDREQIVLVSLQTRITVVCASRHAPKPSPIDRASSNYAYGSKLCFSISEQKTRFLVYRYCVLSPPETASSDCPRVGFGGELIVVDKERLTELEPGREIQIAATKT